MHLHNTRANASATGRAKGHAIRKAKWCQRRVSWGRALQAGSGRSRSTSFRVFVLRFFLFFQFWQYESICHLTEWAHGEWAVGFLATCVQKCICSSLYRDVLQQCKVRLCQASPTTDPCFLGCTTRPSVNCCGRNLKYTVSVPKQVLINLIFKNRDLLFLCYTNVFKEKSMPKLLTCNAKLVFLGNKR